MVNTLELKSLIVKNGFTQKELAKLLGISSVSFNKKLNNVVEFKASEVQKLCNVLNIASFNEIFLLKKVN